MQRSNRASCKLARLLREQISVTSVYLSIYTHVHVREHNNGHARPGPFSRTKKVAHMLCLVDRSYYSLQMPIKSKELCKRTLTRVHACVLAIISFSSRSCSLPATDSPHACFSSGPGAPTYVPNFAFDSKWQTKNKALCKVITTWWSSLKKKDRFSTLVVRTECAHIMFIYSTFILLDDRTRRLLFSEKEKQACLPAIADRSLTPLHFQMLRGERRRVCDVQPFRRKNVHARTAYTYPTYLPPRHRLPIDQWCMHMHGWWLVRWWFFL